MMQNFMVNILSSLRGKLNLQFIVGFSCWIYERLNCRSGYVRKWSKIYFESAVNLEMPY